MVEVKCDIHGNKDRFAKQIATRLHGKIQNESQGHMQISFENSSEAQMFNRFMVVINQSFA